MKILKSFLPLFFRLLSVYLILSISVVSCSKEDNLGSDKDDQSDDIETTVYQKFQKAVSTSLTIDKIVTTQTSTLFTLSDNSTIKLFKEHNVIDINTKGTPVLEKSKTHTWILNGIDSKIQVISGLSKNPVIVCVAYNSDVATVYLDNGNKISINRKGEEAIYSFTLEVTDNIVLNKNIEAVINGTSVVAVLPEGVSFKSLIFKFGYRGVSVMIGNKPQKSGVTINDFTTPLIYSLIKKDGSKIDYTVTIKSMRLPKIYVVTENNAPILNKEDYVTASVRIEDIDKLYTNEASFEGSAGIRGRGNSTWGMPKKPYKIKFDKKAQLLGLSTDKEWALLANYSDKTLLRNITAFEISRIVEMEWTPQSVSVEFFLNGIYQGVYALTEHVKASPERLDMDVVTNQDISGEALTGGYLMELDFHFDEGERFKTNLKQLPMMFKDPDEPTPEQIKYVTDFYNTAESRLYSNNFTDPVNGYSKYIDIESFIKYYIVQELAKNCDGNMRGSCYMSIPRNGKISMPLVWDFDIAFGNANHITWEQGASSVGPNGWYIKDCSPWFDRLFKDPAFVKALKTKWNGVKPQLDLLPEFIQNRADQLKYASRRNFDSKGNGGAGWNIYEIMWPNYINRGNYDAEIKFLKDFVSKRIQWLDENINRL